MPRRARFVVEYGTYHVMERGNNRQIIFRENNDYEYFLELMKKAKFNHKLNIYHYSLMENHLHLMIKSSNGKNLAEAMKSANISYTYYFRRKYGGVGHFFQDRFKSFLIQKGIYMLECGRYIELNPVRAGVVREPGEYKWSSYRVYCNGEKQELIDYDPEYIGLHENEHTRMKIYKKYIMDGIGERRNEERYFKDGICGSKNFLEKMKQKGLISVRFQKGRPRKREPSPFC